MDVKERVRKAIEIDFVDYVYDAGDEYDVHTKDSLAGHRDKRYFRVDTSLFAPFIKEFSTNPDSSYITHINDLVSTGYVPKKVSVLNKVISSNNYDRHKNPIKLVYSEVLSSQILNFFGCPTTCNVAIKPKEEERYEVFSLDFLSYGEDFITFDELCCSFSGDLRENVRMIKYEFRMSYFNKYNQEDLTKVIEDYIYSFFVRRYVIKDMDFYDNNSGIIFNRETGSVKYINFDFEYGFNPSKPHLEENLMYCLEYYPEVYDRFVSKVGDFYDALRQLREEFAIQKNDCFYREMVEEMMDTIAGVVRVTKRLSRRR